jgi:hypothetical protein
VIFTLWPFYLLGKICRYPLASKPGRFQNRSEGDVEKEIFTMLLPGIQHFIIITIIITLY